MQAAVQCIIDGYHTTGVAAAGAWMGGAGPQGGRKNRIAYHVLGEIRKS